MNFKTISTPTQRKRSLQPPIVRPRTAHLPKRAGAREAGGARGRAKPSHKEAKSPSRPCARSHDVVPTEKRRSKRLNPWAFFRLIGELFADHPHRVPPHADARSKSGETGEKTLSRTRAQHRVSVFPLHPSAVIRWFTTHYG